MNYTIFDMLYKEYKPKNKIRLLEFFSGYGSQALALKYLGVDFEHWKTCEWAIKSIQAYKDIHFIETYDSKLTKEEYVNYLFNKGISSNYNEPMTYEQIKRLNEKQLKIIYDNIQVTNNLVNIQQVKGKDLEIVDTDKYDYILTYSFPCQDLSLAGKGKGMSDTSTRSGMLWEVERILKECKELGKLPQILLMENVPQVHSEDNLKDFYKWQETLDNLGYTSYVKDLIATDYGIPQTRNRCFMISILGNYSYTFPKSILLRLKLKDLLEDNVNEKYYLSDKFINCMMVENKGGYPRKQRFEQSLNRVEERNIANTITTVEGQRDISTFIKVPEATKKGYAIAKEGDGIYINRPHQKRGVVQKDKMQTLKTSCDDLGVVTNNLRIRKLTPKECFRLMGVKDKDFKNVFKNQSNSSLYHLAGDSIVVNVLMAIFGELFKINWEEKFNPKEWWNNDNIKK